MMKKLRTIALLSTILIAALFMSVNCNRNNVPDKVAQLDSLFNSIFPANEPGAVVLIMEGDNVIFDKGYGLATIGTGEDKPIDGNTFFNIASCSKQFTAVAVLQLAQQGLIDINEKVNKYLTEYTDPIWDKITIHHLLCHTSGIPDERGYLSREQKIIGDDNLAMEYLQTLDHLNFEPGEKFEYMNPTYVLLGKLVKRVSGQDFADYVHDHLFVPAGMDHSVYYSPAIESDIPNMAHAYKFEDGEWKESDYGESTFYATGPDGGIYSSAHELIGWEKALRNSTVLNEKWLQTAWTPRIKNSEKSWYCYGWGSEGEGAEKRIYHTGGNGGFKTYIVRYPASESLFIILANRADWDIPEVQSKIDQIVSGSTERRNVLNF